MDIPCFFGLWSATVCSNLRLLTIVLGKKGGAQMERSRKGTVPASAHVGLLVRLRLRRRSFWRGEGGKANLSPATGERRR